MATVVGVLVGLVTGVLAVVLYAGLTRRRLRADPPPPGPSGRVPTAMLEEMPVAALAVAPPDVVLFANPAAHSFGLVTDGRVLPDLRGLVRAVRHDAVAREGRVVVTRADLAGAAVPLAVRVTHLGGDEVSVVAQDATEAERVEAVRRDFVANLGHEIKTPVGALSLLAEAALEARDDPPTVEHFVGRIAVESQRLSRLVAELIELSRLQGGDPLPAGETLTIGEIAREAVERARVAAEAKDIGLVVAGEEAVLVRGHPAQLVTAVANLVDNAVAYSEAGTRAVVTLRRDGDVAEIAVTDQGIGIAPADLDRIFERFYRVDPARSRATGGTGLGLAIVKHTASNHGGEVRVWSEPGAGSTFTLRLPVAAAPEPPAAAPDRPRDTASAPSPAG